jgi:hypothetical protein
VTAGELATRGGSKRCRSLGEGEARGEAKSRCVQVEMDEKRRASQQQQLGKPPSPGTLASWPITGAGQR